MVSNEPPGALSGRTLLVLFLAACAVAAVPVLAVETLPIFDYPNHLARMHVILHADDAAGLGRFYAVQWRPLPNLAMDLVVPLLARVMPLAWAGKAFVLATLVLVAGGTCLLHRAIFRRWSAWPLLAFLFLYNREFLWGFLNFLFGLGLALCALAAWVGLRERPAWLSTVGTAAAIAIYLAHLSAFAAYAVALLAGEAAARDGRIRRLGLAAATLAIPAALFLASAGGGAGGEPHFALHRKPDLLFRVFDNYEPLFDFPAFVLLLGLFGYGAWRRAVAFDRAWLAVLAALAVVYVALPARALGGAQIDHRWPLVLFLAVIAGTDLAVPAGRRARWIAAGLALLFIARTGVVTAVWTGYDRIYAPVVAALGALPKGSRLAVATGRDAENLLHHAPPMTHLPALAVIGADAFVPTLFAYAGQQPLVVREPYASLAAAASPDDFWRVFAAGEPDAGGRVAQALAGYDFIVFVSAHRFEMPDDPRLAPRIVSPHARLFAVRR